MLRKIKKQGAVPAKPQANKAKRGTTVPAERDAMGFKRRETAASLFI